MGTCLPYPNGHRHHRYFGVSQNSAATSPSRFVSVSCFSGKFILSSSKINRIRSSLFRSHCLFLPSPSNPRVGSGRCHANSPGPPPPPKLEPPSGENRTRSSGALSTFSEVKDAVRIFFAVFFWMSLFFWSSVWDGRNNGRSNKGPRFRR